jgi:diguanylate cyclase (GGDEF)-like protein
MGGDEFVVLLDGIHQAEHAAIVVDKLRSAISEAVHIGDSVLSVTPSIGIALYPEQGEDVRQLLDGADAAMFEEKRGKPGRLG